MIYIIRLFFIFFLFFLSKVAYADNTDYTYLLKPHLGFLDLTEKIDKTDTDYIFKSPVSRAGILKKFCILKSDKQKQSYIDTLDNIVKNGKNFQKRINYNNEQERLNKRKDENDPKIYRIALEPHTEAAYHLGVIYGFSDCSMRDMQQAIDYFQQAYNKPETYFMTAELYRYFKPFTMQRRINYLYNQAIQSGITQAHYNLALYMYKIIHNPKASAHNPQDFNYQTMIKHLRDSATDNPIAQNDLAIMLKKTNPNYDIKKLYPLMNLYFDKAAQQDFLPAIYNQIIMALSQECTENIQEIIKEKILYLKQQKYPPLIKLLPIIKKHHCFKIIL